MNILEYQNFYLVGIKGVAMTALAQCLLDAGKQVHGSDVAEEFVTEKILRQLPISIDTSFTTPIPPEIDCVIYTAAHQARLNPQVIQAEKRHIPVLSHAEALASLFNQKQGVAVCGVGGKSTTSAMISWILEKVAQHAHDPVPSFAVGVADIVGLGKTGQWNPDPQSPFFVAEADEYVTDPAAPERGETITPRFSFLLPQITVCTNLKYDHPDVYKDFAHTQAVYRQFFTQIKSAGYLVVNADDVPLRTLAESVATETAVSVRSFGVAPAASLQLKNFQVKPGVTISTISDHQQDYELILHIPGRYNVLNAMAAITACQATGISFAESIQQLADFQSTLRRSEFKGEKNGVRYYDDYAHHPDEISQVIQAFKEWFPQQKVIVAFQSHTYSRTKAFLKEFAVALAQADEVVMTDIFSSAREKSDPNITSDLLCAEIQAVSPKLSAQNLHTNEKLAEFCQTQLHAGDVLLTVGAGDIYKVHDLIH